MKRVAWSAGAGDDVESLLSREWLITNGLGGYASGTLAGVPTRRYHGSLIAALPNPLGRTMMFSQLSERFVLPDGNEHEIGGFERDGKLDARGLDLLREVRFESGLPVWSFELGAFQVERSLVFAHLQNTLFIQYRLTRGAGTIQLALRPTFQFRSHDAPVSTPVGDCYALQVLADRYEINSPPIPPVRLLLHGAAHRFVYQPRRETQLLYRVELDRGYEAAGDQWSLGEFQLELGAAPVTLVASTESWGDIVALEPADAVACEAQRRRRLQAIAGVPEADAVGQELVLAADQFVIAPRGRVRAALHATARGDELRSVIAGYHWFTDWGRDTMISLEGLTLRTGRIAEARSILDMFAQYARDGLIPNMFPEGAHEGLYHTADATLWFFHALDRYVEVANDRHTLRELLPLLEDIVSHHIRGTHYGIGIDRADGLLRQGADGFQLTWMDAKCGDWVVTPRRGKAVEINALWYNALRVLARFQVEERGAEASSETSALADRVYESFNRRFWCEPAGHLYDVVDGEAGDDRALRPNQLFSISLPNPVLARDRWKPVLEVVTRELLTPVGLRSLARSERDYKPTYHGDLPTRDAAYHQGTVWSWLIGPYVDAWRKLEPRTSAQTRALLDGLIAHLGEAGIGSVSEVFDAEPPFTPRGCIAQAWGVAEFLRLWSDVRE